jgi:hypothetical protein
VDTRNKKSEEVASFVAIGVEEKVNLGKVRGRITSINNSCLRGESDSPAVPTGGKRKSLSD